MLNASTLQLNCRKTAKQSLVRLKQISSSESKPIIKRSFEQITAAYLANRHILLHLISTLWWFCIWWIAKLGNTKIFLLQIPLHIFYLNILSKKRFSCIAFNNSQVSQTGQSTDHLNGTAPELPQCCAKVALISLAAHGFIFIFDILVRFHLVQVELFMLDSSNLNSGSDWETGEWHGRSLWNSGCLWVSHSFQHNQTYKETPIHSNSPDNLRSIAEKTVVFLPSDKNNCKPISKTFTSKARCTSFKVMTSISRV